MSRLFQSVVAVSGDSLRAELLDGLLADDNDYGVIVVESTARAYSRVKQSTPDLVIVFCEIDDVDACQLLSMLKIDGKLSGVPVVTCARKRVNSEFGGIVSEIFGQPNCPAHAIQMN
jgi:DNA-binding response OmpR family regulator